MRIGVDATCWANPRGYGRFTRNLLPAMVARAPEDTFVCFVDPTAADQFDLKAPNVELRIVAVDRSPTTAAAADGSRSLIDMLRLTLAVTRGSLDVFFSPSVYTYFPLAPGQRAVVTVHDAIAERFPELTLPTSRARLFWKLKVGLALKQARLVMTVSEFAASELMTVLGIPRVRLRVCGEAPAETFRPSRDRAEARQAAAARGVPAGSEWFTYVGGFNPHKHVDVLVRAHAAMSRGRRNPPHLLLVGTVDDRVFHADQAGIRAAIQEAGTEELVHWTGFVPDEELRHLHSGAVALVLPSACEGFGLPAVEAAACGTAVIATSASPLPNLLAGGGIFVKPGDPVEVEAAMRRLIDDEALRETMSQVARKRAGELSWDRAADATLGALREAAA